MNKRRRDKARTCGSQQVAANLTIILARRLSGLYSEIARDGYRHRAAEA